MPYFLIPNLSKYLHGTCCELSWTSQLNPYHLFCLLMSPKMSGARGFPKEHHTSDQAEPGKLWLTKVNRLIGKWHHVEIEL